MFKVLEYKAWVLYDHRASLEKCAREISRLRQRAHTGTRESILRINMHNKPRHAATLARHGTICSVLHSTSTYIQGPFVYLLVLFACFFFSFFFSPFPLGYLEK